MALNKESGGGEYKSHLKLIDPIQMLRHSFHMLSLTLLTLLLPLSFLLLSRLTSSPSPSIPPPLHSALRLLVSSISLSCLFSSVTGHLPRPRPAIAWAVVCSFQACITFGIEATIAQGIKPAHSPLETTRLVLVERAIFFFGLYDTMMHWMRVFVKAVVDDTVYGAEVEEGRVGRLVVGAASGGLWWWMLRDEVEPMVTDAIGGGGKGFVVWVVSYCTAVIGMVRVVEIVFWVGSCLFLFLRCRGDGGGHVSSHGSSNEEVVILL